MPLHCNNCNVDYNEGTYCRRCGRLLLKDAPKDSHPGLIDRGLDGLIGKRDVSYVNSLLSFVLPMLLAMVITAPDPMFIPTIVFFPAGLGAYFTAGQGNADLSFFIGYIVYAIFFFLFFVARSNLPFQMIRITFVFVLFMNIEGCRMLLSTRH